MDFQTYSFTVVTILSVMVIVAQLIMLIVAGSALLGRQGKNSVLDFFTKHGLVLMLIATLVATCGSLFFSEIAGWNPCKYCWIQRIFMYPVAVMLPIAIWKRDRGIARYILALSIIGACYAAYHYYIQMYDIVASPLNPATPCDASGESCVKTPFVEFGYITVPMMALTAFLLNITGSLVLLRKQKA